MLPSSAKKSARKKKVALTHVDRDQVAVELRKWAVDEMCFRPQGRHVNSRIPNVEEFKKLCRGSIIDIWLYVIQHARSTQRVQTIKGNLKLSSLLHKTAPKDSLKEEDTEHLNIIKRIAELQAQIKQVEKDVYHPEKEILQTEQSLTEENTKRRDLEKRCALLSLYSKQCHEKARVFDEFRRRIEGRMLHYRELKRLAHCFLPLIKTCSLKYIAKL